MPKSITAFVSLVALAALYAFVSVPPAAADGCRFVLGFQTVHDAIPDVVGDCRVDVHFNPANGDGLQETTKGLLVWRKADNFTAFTDGYRSWVNGPLGIQARLNTERFDWENDVAKTAASATDVINTTGQGLKGLIPFAGAPFFYPNP